LGWAELNVWIKGEKEILSKKKKKKEKRKNILLAKITSMIETNSILEFRDLINKNNDRDTTNFTTKHLQTDVTS
jgi:hypothetical protein